jgi:hypothetical protein
VNGDRRPHGLLEGYFDQEFRVKCEVDIGWQLDTQFERSQANMKKKKSNPYIRFFESCFDFANAGILCQHGTEEEQHQEVE